MEDLRNIILGLSYLDGMGPQAINKLETYFGSLPQAWSASLADLERVLGKKLGCKAYEHFSKFLPDRCWSELYELGIQVLVRGDSDYPESLESIFDPPRLLFFKGDISILKDRASLGIVGARNCTAYGKSVAYNLAKDLAAAGMGIISGMARGIDTEAHMGAIEGGGVTIAVLGCGVDICYPRENRLLYEQIAANGAIISEFPPGTPPMPFHFPQRNRLISGMSDGVLVVEAAEKSGTLITVDFALEQGRDVFAVPGNINSPVSKGTNRLLQQGAKIVTTAEDILEEYGVPSKDSAVLVSQQLTPQERKVLEAIAIQASADDIIAATELAPDLVLGTLVRLELKKMLRLGNDGQYIKICNF